MGTRNLTMVVSNKEVKVAQYGQWDGNPEENGVIIFKFLKSILNRKSDVEKFKEIIEKCTWITPEKIEEFYKELGVDIEKEAYISLDILELFKEEHPHLDRDMGADILEYLYENGCQELKNGMNFASDSLFCEWAYVVDLDEKNLEVYKGFNKEPLNKEDRFYELINCDEEYFPVKLVKKIPFDVINIINTKEFLGLIYEALPKNEKD